MAVAEETGQLTPERIAELRDTAAAAAERAYAPYSRFRVGAAVLLSNGEVVAGCNVENASYRLTTCAEQTAIAGAVARFGPSIRLLAVVIVHADPSTSCAPCGACRQVIAEFADAHARILFPGKGGEPCDCRLSDLLPSAFSFPAGQSSL